MFADVQVRQHYAAERLHQQGPIAPAQSTYLKTLAVKRDPVQSENERHVRNRNELICQIQYYNTWSGHCQGVSLIGSPAKIGKNG